MFNFLKNISGAIIIGISIIIGLNFQEFKDFSQSTFNSIFYVVSGQKAEDERLRKERIEKEKNYEEKQKQLRKEKIANKYEKLVNEILSKKKNLLTDLVFVAFFPKPIFLTRLCFGTIVILFL